MKPQNGKRKGSAVVAKLQQLFTYSMLQGSVQLTVGTFIVSLWVFVRKLAFTRVCTIATWFIIDVMLVSTTPHMGSRMLGALAPIGTASFSCVYAGAILNLAHAAGPHHVTLLQCILGAVAFLPLVCVRASSHPLTQGVGTLFLLYGGVAYLSGQLVWPHKLLWKNIVWHLTYENYIASAAMAFVGICVLPSLAYTDTRRLLAGTLGGLAACTKQYSNRMWRDEDKSDKQSQAKDGNEAVTAGATNMYEDLTGDQYLAHLRRTTDPAHAMRMATASQALALRPLLAKARALSTLASLEPPFLLPGPFVPAAWAAVMDCVDALLTRICVFEALLSDEQMLLARSDLLRFFQHDFSEAFRAIHSQVGTTLAEWQAALAAGRPVEPRDWASTKAELEAISEKGFKGYWAQYADAEAEVEVLQGSANQVRLVLSMITVTQSLLDGLQAAQNALNSALTPTRDNTGLKPTVQWLMRIIPIALALPWFLRLYQVVFKDLPAWLSSRQAFLAGLRNRMLQYGIKLYALIVLTLVAILVLNDQIVGLHTWNIYNVYLAAVLVMLPKVEATVTSGFFRAIGTFIGACLGYLVMMNGHLATSPYGLMAVVCAISFIFGLWGLGTLKLGVLFLLLSFDALVLCQYVPCCDHPGTKHYWAARIVPIAIGSIYPILWSACLLPVYVSTESMSMLGGAFSQAAGLLRLYTRVHYAAARQAAGIEPMPNEPPPPEIKGMLEKTVAAPIAAVQTSLATETVVWRRGVLVQPPVVHHTLTAMQAMLGLLAAVRITAEQYANHVEAMRQAGAPEGNAYFVAFSMPLAGEIQGLQDMLAGLAASLERLVGNQDRPDLADMRKQIEEFELGRLRLRTHYLQLRAQFHEDVARGKFAVRTLSGKFGARLQPPQPDPTQQLQIVVESQPSDVAPPPPSHAPDGTLPGHSMADSQSGFASPTEPPATATPAEDAIGPISTSGQPAVGSPPRLSYPAGSQSLGGGDAVRFLSWVHAMLGCLDQMLRVAKLVLAEEAQLRHNRWLALPWQPEG